MTGRLVGVISERDYTRKVILKGKSSKEIPVQEIMTSPVIFTTPDEPIETCMALMTAKRIRHLPVLQDDELIGIISIGDLVKAIITAQEEERKRVARELHGGASQALTSLMVGLKVLGKLNSPDEIREHLANLRDVASETLETVHDLALELRPSVLDDAAHTRLSRAPVPPTETAGKAKQ